MNHNNTPPLYALTPIDQTEGLEDGAYWVIIKGFTHLSMEVFDNGKWDSNYINMATNYLRQLPEGTEVLRPGDVAVSRDRLFELNEMVFELTKWQKLVARISGLGILSHSYKQHEKEVEKVVTDLAGTQVLKPREVAVSEEELKHLRECKNKLSELEIEYDRLHEEAMIRKYESGNS